MHLFNSLTKLLTASEFRNSKLFLPQQQIFEILHKIKMPVFVPFNTVSAIVAWDTTERLHHNSIVKLKYQVSINTSNRADYITYKIYSAGDKSSNESLPHSFPDRCLNPGSTLAILWGNQEQSLLSTIIQIWAQPTLYL